MKEPNKIEAMVKAKCPQCRKGNLFTHPWWNLFKFDRMHVHCPECGLRYEREPGFFYGAMYISYAFTVGIMLVGGFIIYNYFGDPEPLGYIIPIVLISVLFVPFNFRIARVLFIHFFSGVEYKKEKKASSQK
ncbi:DUF983 domain-containing protein [Flectobacillus major]|jgi:uncharacterized protein (DUF983 family)|uniref:DUF983 domain-containing protein n=1 Tax=Flectobacillus major TaxID=103 RepID=UPI00047B9790|nr:DUF983 domain-containing protein [Flectobacillus major]